MLSVPRFYTTEATNSECEVATKAQSGFLIDRNFMADALPWAEVINLGGHVGGPPYKAPSCQ